MNKPIVFDNAINRVGDNAKLFEYDYSKDLNVVTFGNLAVAFIDTDKHLNELVTKTRVERERDDEDICTELKTKTEVKRERDDEDNTIYEMMTKTYVDRERDDEDPLELQTKTKMERERDD